MTTKSQKIVRGKDQRKGILELGLGEEEKCWFPNRKKVGFRKAGEN